MTDLKYDIAAMDLAIENGDFVFNENPSEQNGALLLLTKNCFLSQPLAGIGINELVNANTDVIVRELNRWQSQALQDGAKSASWRMDNGKITTKCDYTV